MIIHIDMDAFYASVEQRDDKSIAGKPVIVGGTPQQRGVVAAASYEARTYGIRSAMASSRAIQLCPDAIFVPMNMQRYSDVSMQIRKIFHRYTPEIEPLALDEAFLDVAASTKLFGSAETIAKQIKVDIKKELNLTASAGIAPNKFLAKIASDLKKPDGFVVVPSPCQPFLDPLPVTRLWGVGSNSAQKLSDLGVFTIGDFRRRNPHELQRCLGHSVDKLILLARGIDDRKVVSNSEPVSISREITFSKNINESEQLKSTLLRLTEDVASTLRRRNLTARTVGIKIRYADFTTITRDQTFSIPTDVTQIIYNVARALLDAVLENQSFNIRLIGVRLSSLEDKSGEFESILIDDELTKQTKVDSVVDQINRKFGKTTLHRGLKSSL